MVSNFSADKNPFELVYNMTMQLQWEIEHILETKQKFRSHNINFLVLEEEKERHGIPYDVHNLLEHFICLDDEHIIALKRIKAQVITLSAVVDALEHID